MKKLRSQKCPLLPKPQSPTGHRVGVGASRSSIGLGGFNYDVERLLVPIFMVPGNHDFRKYPYDLIFRLMISDAVLSRLADAVTPGIRFRPKGLSPFGLNSSRKFDNSANYNMTWQAARALTSLHNNGNGDFIDREPDDARRFVAIEPDPPFSNVIKRGNLIIKLGDHRIVMLDSSHDLGVTEGMWDALLTHFLERDEDKETFTGGSPNCVGVREGDVTLVTRILKDMNEVSSNGLFILGLHAPLVNISEDSNAYFFRETQRPAQTEQVESFLAHRAQVDVSDKSERHSIIQSAYPEWFPINGDHNEPTLLKRGARDRLLRFGVSHGESEDELMRVLAGIDAPHRKADVVLAGHTHCHNEFRIAVDPASGEPTFYTDFYTFNPRAYYPTRFYSGWFPAAEFPITINYVPGTEVTYVEITDEAERNAMPWPMPYDANHKFIVRVSGYYDPLSHTNNPRAWWNEHRPLLLQTGALGPMKNNQVDFAGFRLLAIKNDVIEKIHFVSIELLEKNDYRLPWEEAIKPEPERRYKYVERSRYFHIPGAVGPPASVALASGETKTVYRDGDGMLWEMWTQPDRTVGYRKLTEAAQAAHASGDASMFLNPNTQVPIALHRGDDGHVHSIYWAPGEIKSERLSASAQPPAPKAATDTVPTGHYSPTENTTYVVYRDTDNNIQTLYWKDDEAATHSDGAYINVNEGWPLAQGNPSSYVDAEDRNHIVYRGMDNEIHCLYWRPIDSVGLDNLSAVAEAPLAAGDPVSYFIPSHPYGENFSSVAYSVHQSTYRSVDGDLIELWWVGSERVNYGNLTQVANGPKAVADPYAYYDPVTNTKHVFYFAEDEHLHELWWYPGTTAPQDVDITIGALAPPAGKARPFAFVTQNPNRQHVVYRGTDNQFHEIHWS
ncbi:MAG: hypothetical protein ACKVQW_02770 [Pyrinomonadaceae bacterium]